MDKINFVNHMANYIGETVTIFTTSGGESGMGFTGVVLSVNHTYVRLITQIGAAPGCALGNCCIGSQHGSDGEVEDGIGNGDIDKVGGDQGRFNCSVRRIGSIADIPVERIAAFVHNTV
jgi:hypothetical protein